MFVWSGSEFLCYLKGKAPHIYDPGRQNASPRAGQRAQPLGHPEAKS